ncbi:MAG: T9SS type A sorting domain-containing protein [Bacteroidetes bacterium]|nr:T9SS type A sorting domain-containing protein [Bacteroidota bacterium]
MKKLLSILIILAAFGSTVQIHAQEPRNVASTIFQEDFNNWTQDSLTANGWSTVTVNWNYITPQDDLIQYFKQVNANWMLLVTPGIDLTGATMLIFDQQRYSTIAGMKIKVGLMSTPTDTNGFQMLGIFNVTSSTWVTDTIFLSGYTGTYYIGFNCMGPIPYTLFNIDNVVVKGDVVQANWPMFVTNLHAVPGPGSNNYAFVSWTNPTKEADGDPLTDLDSVVVLANGVHAFTLMNPVIGGDTTVQVNVPAAGFYQFTATAYNTAGASDPMSTDTIWVGLDTPGAAQNVILTVVNDSTGKVDWTPPIAGAHGAYYNNVVDSYKVIRADGTEFTVNGSTLTFSETLTVPGTYNYWVIPTNASGQGTPAASNAGAFYFQGFLLWEDYWVDAPAFGWTESGAGQSKEWFQDYFQYTPGTPPEAFFWPRDWLPFTGTHRMVSPVLNTTGKTAISLDFLYYAEWAANSYIFKVETTSDGGTTWQDAWVSNVTQTIPAEDVNVVLKNSDVGSPSFQFSYTFVGHNLNASAIAIDQIRVYPTVAVDVAPLSLTLPDYIRPGDIVIPPAEIKSYGSLDTTYTARLTFSQGTDTVYTSTRTGPIAAGATMPITFDSWTAAEGTYVALIKVSCPGDENSSNNTRQKNFGVYSSVGSRTLVVCEEFTGTWCAYCPGAAMGLDDLVSNTWPVAVIGYHVGDSYENPAAVTRKDYFNIQGYPTVFFDGIDGIVGGYAAQSMYSEYWPVVQARMAISSDASVAIADLAISDSTVSAKVKLGSASPIANPNLVLHAVVTESKIQESWQNQDHLDFVERTMVGGPAGIPVDLSPKADSIPVQFILSHAWNKSNCLLVAYIQDTVTKEILNGNQVSLKNLGNGEPEINTALYPVPAHEKLMILAETEMKTIDIFNIMGQAVYHADPAARSFQVNTSGFNAGIYLVRISTAKGVALRKVVVE